MLYLGDEVLLAEMASESYIKVAERPEATG